MKLAEIVIGSVALWLLKQILGPLIDEQVRGSIPDYAARKVRAAGRLLPPELAEEYERDWQAELHALKHKPLSTLKYAQGLTRAARVISGKPARPRFPFAGAGSRWMATMKHWGPLSGVSLEGAADFAAQEPSPIWGFLGAGWTLATVELISLFLGPLHGIALTAVVVLVQIPFFWAFLRFESNHGRESETGQRSSGKDGREG